MSYKDEIKELLKKLAERMQDPDLEWLDTNYSLKDNIDQNFSLEDAAGNVLEYWNESVKKLLEKLKDELDNPWGTGENINKNVSKEHDAAFDFNKQYVSPNPNLNSEKYEDNRTDEIISVLQNKKNLDYTIEEISSELKKYVTRLIMPQYQRRVEIEDLNRNFWVIGQNLSLLNKFILDLDGPILGAIKDLISEITGLWDNVYRIWQAILHLTEKTDEVNDSINNLASIAAKTRVKLAYGQAFGHEAHPFNSEKNLKRLYKYNEDGTPLLTSDNKLQLTDYIVFEKGDIAYFGLIPAIEKEEIKYIDVDASIKTGWLAYLSYNKEINSDDLEIMSEDDLEKKFLDTSSEASLVKIERKFGNRPIKDIIKDIRTKNFVLLAPLLKGEAEIVDKLIVTYDPYLTFLQFIRDVLFYDVEEIVEQLTMETVNSTTSLASLRIAYLNWLIFTKSTKWSLNETVPEKFKSALKYIQEIKPNILNETVFKDLIVDEDTDIKKLITILCNTGGVSRFLQDFYKVYKNIAIELGIKENDITENEFPYFIENKNSYTIIEDDVTGLNRFLNMVKSWKQENNYDSQGTISFCPTYLLFSGKDDLFLDDKQATVLINGVNYKIAKPEGVTIPDIANISWDLICNEFVKAAFDKFTNFIPPEDNMSPQDKINSQHYITYFNKGYLPAYNNNISDPAKRMQDMLEVVTPDSSHFIENESGVFGCSNMYLNHPVFGLWFDFIKDGTGNGLVGLTGHLVSLTARLFNDNGFQNTDYAISATKTIMKWQNIYNVDIQAQLIGNINQKYWDFIRYGKPYPSISCLLHDKSIEKKLYETNPLSPSKIEAARLHNHICSLNNPHYIIHYDSPLRVEGQWDETENQIKPIYKNTCDAIDGFIGFASGRNYPTGFINPTIKNLPYQTTVARIPSTDTDLQWDAYCGDFERRRVDNDGNEIFYYGPTFDGEKQYSICSTDLINAYKDSGTPRGDNWKSDIHEGYTMWENTNMKDSPAITISYLLSDTNEQQLSILVSKDTTSNNWGVKPTSALVEATGYHLNYDELDPNSLYGLTQTSIIDNADNLGIDFFALEKNEHKEIYNGVEEDLLGEKPLHRDSYEGGYFYKQKLSFEAEVNGGYRTSSANTVSSGNAIATGDFIEFLSVDNAKTMIQTYIEHNHISKPNYFLLTRTVYNHLSTLNRKDTPQAAGMYLGYIGTIDINNKISLIPINRVLTPSSKCKTCSSAIGNDHRQLIFSEEYGVGYGHIHKFNRTGKSTTWGLTAYANVKSVDNITKKMSIEIYFPDIAYIDNKIATADNFIDLKNKYNKSFFIDGKNKEHVYATVIVEGVAQELTNEDFSFNEDVNIKINWHESVTEYEHSPDNNNITTG